jgi:hypothetical protein
MVSLAPPLFLMTVSVLLVHELDAVRRREWRFFFAAFPVSDETGYRLFAALHVPLLVVVLWSLESAAFRVGFDAFVVAHGLLHALLRNHPRLEFEGRFSWLWILGGSVLAGGHLLLVL